MTKYSLSEQTEIAKLAYALAGDLPKADAKALLADVFARQHDITADMAWALFVRGKTLAKGRAA